MALHIHIHRGRTADEVKHDPKNGQFTSGGGSSGTNPNKAKALAAARAGQKADAEEKAKGYKELEKHPMYAKEDFDYLKDKGYSPQEIKSLWDRDQKAGKGPNKVNKNSPKMQEHFHLLKAAMGGK